MGKSQYTEILHYHYQFFFNSKVIWRFLFLIVCMYARAHAHVRRYVYMYVGTNKDQKRALDSL